MSIWCILLTLSAYNYHTDVAIAHYVLCIVMESCRIRPQLCPRTRYIYLSPECPIKGAPGELPSWKMCSEYVQLFQSFSVDILIPSFSKAV